MTFEKIDKSKRQKSELLLPVGNMEMCLAAIHNGADAIYVGMPHFNARGRSLDLSLDELKEMIELCHLYGVKVYIAFNIVIFEREMHEALAWFKKVLGLGPDAFILQDIGLAYLIRQMSGDVRLHASTQMTVTGGEGILLLSDLSFSRFVLGREVSIDEMKKIKRKIPEDVELEVFVHGALCVAYSGQCLTSESIGGRSANRGQCAQSCRFEYQMIWNGKNVWKKSGNENRLDIKYLLSPKDLCGIAQIPELAALGISSFKVEGRLKSKEYVIETAKSYRKAIDLDFQNKSYNQFEIERTKLNLEKAYSRGLYTGWLNGVNHQALVSGEYSSHRGPLFGNILKIKTHSVTVKKSALKQDYFDYIDSPNLGDGILLAGADQLGNKVEWGGKIYAIKVLNKDENIFEYYFQKNRPLPKNLVNECKMYLNRDEKKHLEWKKSETDKSQKRRVPISLEIEAINNKALKLTATDGINRVVIERESIIEIAKNNPITQVEFVDILVKLSGSVFVIEDMEKDIVFKQEFQKDWFISHKSLKEMKQQMISDLSNLRVTFKNIDLKNSPNLSIKYNHDQNILTPDSFKLNIMLRESAQVEDLVKMLPEDSLRQVAIVYLDFEFGKDYLSAVKILKEKNLRVGIATTRILKPNEYHHFREIERCKPDVVLCRNLGSIYFFTQISEIKSWELKGDFSLNVTNSWSLKYFLDKGLSSLSASYDLDSEQLFDLVSMSPVGKLEVTIHQYMPSFHMEHCVFAAFLSDGTSFKDCGRPCEQGRLELKDQFGNYHFIRADQECRNTMYNGTAQSSGLLLEKLKRLGVNEFRFEALYERKSELIFKICSYLDILNANDPVKLRNTLSQIKIHEKYGISNGNHRNKEYIDQKKTH